MAKKTIKVAHGHVLVRHKDPKASCTIGGTSYEASADGIVVPAVAVDELRSHGFYPDSENVEQEPAPETGGEGEGEGAAGEAEGAAKVEA